MPDLVRPMPIVLLAALLATMPAAAQRPDEDPAATRAYLSANGLLNRGLYDLAVTEYRQFLERHPAHEKSAMARYGLGVSLFRLRQYDAAVAELSRLRSRETFPYAVEVTVVLGQSHLARRDFTSAIACLEEAGIDPEHPLADDAAVLLAEALHEAGEPRRVANSSRRLNSSISWGRSKSLASAQPREAIMQGTLSPWSASERSISRTSPPWPMYS